MKKHDELWEELNTLLCCLRGFNTVRLVNDYFMSYGNDAPAVLLQQHIDKIQNQLNEAGE